MDAIQGIALRGICANYFENHVSPILKYVQQAQEQLIEQNKELKDTLARKADVEAVPTLADFQSLSEKKAQVAPAPDMGGNGVTMMARIQDLQSTMQKKADVANVPSLAQMAELRKLVQQKANAKDVATAEQLAEVTATLVQKADASCTITPAQLEELASSLEGKIGAQAQKEAVNGAVSSKSAAALQYDLESSTQESLRTLRQEVETSALQICTLHKELSNRTAELTDRLENLASLQKSSSPDAGAAEVRKMQVVVTAASARFDKQLKEVKQQLQTLNQVQEQGVSLSSLRGNPETPRNLRRNDSFQRDDASSVADSDLGSISVAGSVSGLKPEEKAELKKMQAVVAAAGSVFNKELREVRRQMQVMQAELKGIKSSID